MLQAAAVVRRTPTVNSVLLQHALSIFVDTGP